jgi:hypothetical protein
MRAVASGALGAAPRAPPSRRRVARNVATERTGGVDAERRTRGIATAASCASSSPSRLREGRGDDGGRVRRARSTRRGRNNAIVAATSGDDGDGSGDATTKLATSAASSSPHNQASAASRVVEFVAAWDALSPRIAAASANGEHGVQGGDASAAQGNREMLLAALKLAIPRLQKTQHAHDAANASSSSSSSSDRDGSVAASDLRGGASFSSGSSVDADVDAPKPPLRPTHERAVEVTLALVDLGMDAECMSAGLLREALVSGSVTLDEIEASLGAGVMRLAHDCARLHALPRRVGSFDDANAEKLRTFCLTFHDVRAVVVELAYRRVLSHTGPHTAAFAC